MLTAQDLGPPGRVGCSAGWPCHRARAKHWLNAGRTLPGKRLKFCRQHWKQLLELAVALSERSRKKNMILDGASTRVMSRVSESVIHRRGCGCIGKRLHICCCIKENCIYIRVIRVIFACMRFTTVTKTHTQKQTTCKLLPCSQPLKASSTMEGVMFPKIDVPDAGTAHQYITH